MSWIRVFPHKGAYLSRFCGCHEVCCHADKIDDYGWEVYDKCEHFNGIQNRNQFIFVLCNELMAYSDGNKIISSEDSVFKMANDIAMLKYGGHWELIKTNAFEEPYIFYLGEYSDENLDYYDKTTTVSKDGVVKGKMKMSLKFSGKTKEEAILKCLIAELNKEFEDNEL